MKAWFLRHGQTEYNLRGLCNDDPERNVRLTGTGRAQIRAAAQRLAGEPIERIIVSPLPRTRESAELVDAGRGLPIQVHADIHDIRTGFDGGSYSAYRAAIAHDPLHARAPGGESVADHRARVQRFLGWLAMQPWHCVLVVAHEETLRLAKARRDGLPETALFDLKIDNGELVALDLSL